MSEEVAEVTYRDQPTGITFSGPDGEELAWRYIMRKAMNGEDTEQWDVNVGMVEYGE